MAHSRVVANGDSGVDSASCPGCGVDYTVLEAFRITGTDGLRTTLVCTVCPPSDSVFHVAGNAAVVVQWIVQHGHLRH